MKQGKKGKKKGISQAEQYETQKVSNYDLLKKLGFDDQLIEENKRLGLKEKPAQSMRAYMVEMEERQKEKAQIHERTSELK